MLKRLATAGVLTVAAGGVLMSAAPAMAGDDHGYHHHHGGPHHGYHDRYYKHHEDNWFDVDFRHDEENERVENETFAVLNCLNITAILATSDQECYIGNVAGD